MHSSSRLSLFFPLVHPSLAIFLSTLSILSTPSTYCSSTSILHSAFRYLLDATLRSSFLTQSSTPDQPSTLHRILFKYNLSTLPLMWNAPAIVISFPGFNVHVPSIPYHSNQSQPAVYRITDTAHAVYCPDGITSTVRASTSIQVLIFYNIHSLVSLSFLSPSQWSVCSTPRYLHTHVSSISFNLF